MDVDIGLTNWLLGGLWKEREGEREREKQRYTILSLHGGWPCLVLHGIQLTGTKEMARERSRVCECNLTTSN